MLRRSGLVVCLLGAAWGASGGEPGVAAGGEPVGGADRLDSSAFAGYRAAAVGWFRVMVSEGLLAEDELRARVFETLSEDLERIAGAVPGSALALLRDRVTIWVEKQGAEVPGGMSGRGMVYHPSAIWLKANGLLPVKAGGIEVVRAEDYLEWRADQPMMVLHELAHAYHHLIGLEHPEIVGAFESARDSGRYGEVGHVRGGTREAYAMRNATEYFAELSEAYFGRNDFEPYDREALRAFDPRGFRMVEVLWSLDGAVLSALIGEGAGAGDEGP